jgi:hypothetical protein
MFKKISLCLLVVCFLASTSTAYAFESSGWTKLGTKSEQTRAKMEFGLKNFFFGWTELFQEPYQAYKGTGSSDIAWGIGDAIVNSIWDTVGGALHFATFPCTQIDVPLPEGGTDIF